MQSFCFVSILLEQYTKYIAADISSSLNLKKTLESSAFEVAKDMFSFSCLEVFAPIRMGVSIRYLKDLTNNFCLLNYLKSCISYKT